MIKINNQKLLDLYFKIREELENGKEFTSVDLVATSLKSRERYRYELVLNSSKGDLKIAVEARLEHSEYINVYLKLNDDDIILDEKGIKIVALMVDLFKSRKESRINNLIDSVLEDSNKGENESNIKLNKCEIRFLLDLYKKAKENSILYSSGLPKDADVIYYKLKSALKRL